MLEIAMFYPSNKYYENAVVYVVFCGSITLTIGNWFQWNYAQTWPTYLEVT